MRCKYDKTVFQSPNGYCIFRYKTKDANLPLEILSSSFRGTYSFTAVGYNMPATSAVEVELQGDWQKTKYGLQLNVESCEQITPKDSNAIIAYLSSGLIKGIGPGTAKAIVDRFGPDTLDILDNDPRQLLSVKGIAEAKLEKIMSSYEETRKMRDLAAYLAPYDISLKKISKIREAFGDRSLQIVKTDPFQLCRIPGFGFLTVDSIARKTKVSLQHPLRYEGAIKYVLEDAKNSGHLFLPLNELLSRCHELLNRDLDREVVTELSIRQAVISGQKDEWLYNESGRVYLAFDRTCEVQAARRIVSMLLTQGNDCILELDRRISDSEAKLNQTLSPSQRNAVTLCLSKPVSVITGGPGTGKTTTLKVVLDVYHQYFPYREILLAAPTGKASRRMTEQTGFPASTLHSAMSIITEQDYEEDEPELLSADFVVVDECSMVDMHLAYALFKRLKSGAKLLFVGDPDQLPSVGAGNVLREMIRSELVPTAVLDTVFRQAENSRIALNAYAINHNDSNLQYGDDFVMYNAADSEDAAHLVIKNYLSEIQKNGIESVQIISPFRRKGSVGADSLNTVIRSLVNPPRDGVRECKCGSRVIREGDRIIQTKNYETVSNGDMGIVTAIRTDEDGESTAEITLLDGRVIQYSAEMLEDIDFSYCISIHKSQGAEFPTAIIPLMKEHYVMLRRNLLYTAVSRAKSKVILIGQKQAVFMAIHKNDVDKRNTVFADRICTYYKRELERRQIGTFKSNVS